MATCACLDVGVHADAKLYVPFDDCCDAFTCSVSTEILTYGDDTLDGRFELKADSLRTLWAALQHEQNAEASAYTGSLDSGDRMRLLA